MGNGIIGKILYFWIFIIGGLFFAKLLGFAGDDNGVIMFCVALAVIYIVFQIARTMGMKKHARNEEENREPVRKGQSNKRKKR